MLIKFCNLNTVNIVELEVVNVEGVKACKPPTPPPKNLRVQGLCSMYYNTHPNVSGAQWLALGNNSGLSAKL